MGYIGNVANGAIIDERLEYVRYLMQYTSQIIGFEIDTQSSTPTVRIIDKNGYTFTPAANFFNNHAIWGRIRAAFYKDGVISYGTNNRGDGKLRDGTDGDVLTEFPTANVLVQYKDSRYIRIYVEPVTSNAPYFSVHPAAVQRGGTKKSKIYLSAYEASLAIDQTNGNIKFQSVAGVQPFTGSSIHKLQFTSGGTSQISIGNTITGGTSNATGIVVATYISSGTWAGGNAAGYLYLKTKTGTFQASEPILVSGTDHATASGVETAVTLTLTNAETYANNIGTGFGVQNYWFKRYIDILQIIEAGTLNIPSVFGRGIVDLPTGTGFAGKLTGADSIDSRTNEEGTGVGSGTDGQTPIKWRNSENLYGHVWKHVAGLNVFTDGSYKVLKRDGTGAIAEIMTTGIESGTGVTTADGYIKEILTDELGALAFIPKTVGGTGASNSTYFCDKYYGTTNTNASTFYGGAWQTVYESGPFLFSNSSANGATNGALGCFYEYYV